MVSALLSNPHLDLGPYLHKLMPAVMTCLLTRRLGSSPHDSHWAVRDQAARMPLSMTLSVAHTGILCVVGPRLLQRTRQR